MAFTPLCATCRCRVDAHAPDCFWSQRHVTTVDPKLVTPKPCVIEISAEDAAHLSEAYRYSQFSPDSRGQIYLANMTLAALRRVLDAIDNTVHPKE